MQKLSFALSWVVLLALPIVAHAQFSYTTNSGTITITGYSGAGLDVTIPSSINGYPVTSIGNDAFYGSGLTNVTIPNSVTNIDNYAFWQSSLQSIAVDLANPSYASAGGVLFNKTLTTLVLYPEGLTGSYAIPNSVTAINAFGFSGSGLTSVTIPNSVTNIGDWAFANCSGLTSVTIPDSVTTIGPSAFEYCSGLKSLTIGNSVKTLGDFAFDYCSGLKSLTIGNSVKTLGDWAFANCSGLTSVTIPNSVTDIGDSAFYGSGLKSVAIPDSVINIGNAAFAFCYGLTSVTIGNGVTHIGSSAFALCSGLTNIAVDLANPSFASAGGLLFNKTKTTIVIYPPGLTGSYAIPNSVTAISAFAFSGSGLTSVTIPNSVTNIGESAFYYCPKLTSVTIPNSVATIPDGAFDTCSGLKSVTIPNGVTSIGTNAFYSCSGLKSVTIPSSVKTLCDFAFSGSGLTRVTIPNNVTNIGYGAFYLCSGLTNAFFQGDAPSVNGWPGSADSSVFYGDTGTVYYVTGTTGWGSTFGGWPTVLWNPQATTFSFAGGHFGFNLTGPTNAMIVVEACTNLSNPVWLPVSTNTLTGGASSFSDPQSVIYPSRFYRFRSP